MSTATAPAALSDLLPESRVLTGPAASEWTGGMAAEAVLFPVDTDEVQALVRAANETETRLLPAGAGSWLDAGGWTRSGGVIVSTARLDSVLHYEPADLTLTAGAGLGWRKLAALLEPNGQWLPVDGPGVGVGTLGGAVACGVPGPLRGRYGAVRDNVLGLEVVTGDGRVLRIGGRVVKNVAGYDLVRLFTGSRGSLGVITRVSVRLFPRPEADVTMVFEGGGVEEVLEVARVVRKSPLPVAAAELVVRGAGGARDAELAVRVLGGGEEADDVCSRLVAGIGAAPGRTMRGGESEVFHRRRIGWEGRSPLVVRLAALPGRLAATMERAREVAGGIGGKIAGDVLGGVVRVKGSPGGGGAAGLAETLTRVRREMEAADGTMTLSRAPREVAATVGWTGGGGALAEKLKSLFDPRPVLESRCP